MDEAVLNRYRSSLGLWRNDFQGVQLQNCDAFALYIAATCA